MWATPGWSCCPCWRTNSNGDIAEGKLPLPNLAGHTNDTVAYTPEQHFKSRWGRYSPRLQFSVIPQSQLFQGMTDLRDYKIVLSLIFRFASLFLFWAPTQPEVLILMAIASPPEGPNPGKIWSTNKIDVTAAINTWGLENETRGFMEVTKADAGGFTAAYKANGAGRCTHTKKKQQKNKTSLLIHSLTFRISSTDEVKVWNWF